MTNKELEKKFSKLTEVVATLVDRLEPKVQVVAEEKPEKKESSLLDKRLGGESDTIPEKFREIVDGVLNKKFGVHLKDKKLTILVPLEYTPLSVKELAEVKADLRPKVLENINDFGSVETWCNLVYSNFEADTRLKIKADR